MIFTSATKFFLATPEGFRHTHIERTLLVRHWLNVVITREDSIYTG